MSFKKALTKMGLVEEEIQVAPKKATAPAATNPTAFTAPSFYQAPAATPTVDPAFSQLLAKSLEDSKLAQFDYMKFTSAVEGMKTYGAPEDARYKMAYATAQTLGVDKAFLLKSGDHYLGVLKEDEDDFNNDCAEFERGEIKSREAKISQMEDSMTNLSKQLAQLQQDHQNLSQELQEKKSSLDNRRSSFQATLQSFRSAIESNIQKINQYLQ